MLPLGCERERQRRIRFAQQQPWVGLGADGCVAPCGRRERPIELARSAYANRLGIGYPSPRRTRQRSTGRVTGTGELTVAPARRSPPALHTSPGDGSIACNFPQAPTAKAAMRRSKWASSLVAPSYDAGSGDTPRRGVKESDDTDCWRRRSQQARRDEKNRGRPTASTIGVA